jgi:hypothetical protein
MSTRASSPKPGVFGPYDAERHLASDIETVYCTRCPHHGRRTALVITFDAIGREVERCPVCDGVAKPQRLNPNEVLKPQALIGRAQLLPPCPPGKLRCQSCAKPVEGDERLCVTCALPGLDPTSWDSEHVSISAVVRAARVAAGISMAEVARRMGLGGSSNGVSRLESDDYHSHTMTSLTRFAAAVGCRVIVRLVKLAEGDR